MHHGGAKRVGGLFKGSDEDESAMQRRRREMVDVIHTGNVKSVARSPGTASLHTILHPVKKCTAQCTAAYVLHIVHPVQVVSHRAENQPIPACTSTC